MNKKTEDRLFEQLRQSCARIRTLKRRIKVLTTGMEISVTIMALCAVGMAIIQVIKAVE